MPPTCVFRLSSNKGGHNAISAAILSREWTTILGRNREAGMRRGMVIAVAAVVLTTTAGVVGPASAAQRADACVPTGARTTNTVETRFLTGRDSDKLPVLVLRGLQMCAGRPHLFVGGYVATVSENMLQATDIRCVPRSSPGDAAAQSRRRSVYSTRNHGTPISAARAIAVRWMFTPDQDNIYDCELRGWGKAADSDPAARVTVADDPNTVLRVSGVEDGATEWRQDADEYLCWDVPDDPGCRRADVPVLAKEFRAADNATGIDVYAGVEASVCTGDYKNCGRVPGTAGSGDFTVRVRLIATQLLTAGTKTICPGTEAAVAELPRVAIPGAGELNHTKIHVSMPNPVPISTNPQCSRSFAIRVLVDYVRTNPEQPNHGGLVEGKIADKPGSGDPDELGRYYTSAMAANNP
jgi:hypothetical protein